MTVPVQLRAGGAFMAVALVLLIYAALAYLRGDATFGVTPQVLSIVAAAVIFGANATFVRGQERSRPQVVALALAVVLLVVGFLAPSAELFVTQPFWLILWAVTAAVCALILRRSAM